jgi:hypothetical protein
VRSGTPNCQGTLPWGRHTGTDGIPPPVRKDPVRRTNRPARPDRAVRLRMTNEPTEVAFVRLPLAAHPSMPTKGADPLGMAPLGGASREQVVLKSHWEANGSCSGGALRAGRHSSRAPARASRPLACSTRTRKRLAGQAHTASRPSTTGGPSRGLQSCNASSVKGNTRLAVIQVRPLARVVTFRGRLASSCNVGSTRAV